MDTSNTDGIRQRPGKVEDGAPVPATTVKMKAKEDTEQKLGKPHHPVVQILRVVGLVGYFIVACLWCGAPGTV